MGRAVQVSAKRRIAASIVFGFSLSVASVACAGPVAAAEGIQFTCDAESLTKLEVGMAVYLRELGISSAYVDKHLDTKNGTATYTLTTPKSDVSTIDFFDRAEYALRDEVLHLPVNGGKTRQVKTASRKEIMLALMQHGRLTEFKGKSCDIVALKDHVGIRQNTTAWAEVLEFGWPEGGPAKWNEKYWKRGTPKPGYRLHVAINDMFLNQKKYEIGCYTATKMVVIQGVLDYYHRVKKDPVTLKLVETRLSVDGEPLVNIEAGRVWDFEPEYDPNELNRPGKLLDVKYGVAPKNFVPGDWAYLWNTDPVSYQKTGYEGSNAIYLGRGKFDDYYNDHDHSYSYRQKLHEVYQWRNGVFSRSRDAAKVKPLLSEDYDRLSKTPAKGGLVLDLRIVPYQFGYESLPDWKFGQ